MYDHIYNLNFENDEFGTHYVVTAYLIKINSNSAEKVLDAFVLVSDPIYNGHTTKLNKIIDDLPEKKTKN